MNFGINIEDNSNVLDKFVIDSNEKSVKLHDWQERAIKYFFEHNGKSIFEVATGAGKTFLAISILKKIHELEPNLKCLIVVPKNVILESGWYKSLYDFGYTLPEIGIYYGLGKEYSRITLTNVQSLSKVATELFEIVIFDELHNLGAPTLLKYVKDINWKYMIGLSATVERRDNIHFKIAEAFNYNQFIFSPGQAIQENVLNNFRLYNIAVEMDENTMEEYLDITKNLNTIMQAGGGFNRIMKSRGGLKYKMLSLMTKRKQLINNYHRKFEVAKEICKKYNNEKIIVFNEYNAQTSKIYWHLLESNIHSRVVHSNIKQLERDNTLIDFRKGLFNVLLTTKVLDEGFDLPAISCAIIMAGTSTARQSIQRLGRILRRKNTESILFQIYCKNTIEEDYNNQRSVMFKELCSYYKEYLYKLDNKLILN